MPRDCRAKYIADQLIDIHRSYGWRAHREYPFLNRRIDVLAIGPKGSEVIAFEIKITRADFFSEIKNPSKRLRVSNNCSQFYYVTPTGLISGHEIPDGCGLIYYNSSSDTFSTALPIPNKSSLLCHLELRRIDDQEEERRVEWERQQFLEDMYDTPACPDELPYWMLPADILPPIDLGDDLEVFSRNMPSVSMVHVYDFQEVPF